MSKVCISETREVEEEGIGTESKISSVAFCMFQNVVRQEYVIRQNICYLYIPVNAGQDTDCHIIVSGVAYFL
jgi:hypothetical protein